MVTFVMHTSCHMDQDTDQILCEYSFPMICIQCIESLQVESTPRTARVVGKYSLVLYLCCIMVK